jgi:hypothetical protein
MTFLRTLLRLLCHPLCTHKETLTKTEGTRAYTECLRCEYQSKGVEIAGHNYESTKHSWEPGIDTVIVLPRKELPTRTAEDRVKMRSRAPQHFNDFGDYIGHVARVDSAPEPEYTSIDWAPERTEFSVVTNPGNLAGHAMAVRCNTVATPLCSKCGDPIEATRPRSNKCRACDRAKPKRKPRKISAIKPRKTSRKPSSKRSKTA